MFRSQLWNSAHTHTHTHSHTLTHSYKHCHTHTRTHTHTHTHTRARAELAPSLSAQLRSLPQTIVGHGHRMQTFAPPPQFPPALPSPLPPPHPLYFAVAGSGGEGGNPCRLVENWLPLRVLLSRDNQVIQSLGPHAAPALRSLYSLSLSDGTAGPKLLQTFKKKLENPYYQCVHVQAPHGNPGLCTAQVYPALNTDLGRKVWQSCRIYTAGVLLAFDAIITK